MQPLEKKGRTDTTSKTGKSSGPIFLDETIFLISKIKWLIALEYTLLPCFQEASHFIKQGHFIQGLLKKSNNSLDFIILFLVLLIHFLLHCWYLWSKIAIIMTFVSSKIAYIREKKHFIHDIGSAILFRPFQRCIGLKFIH